MNLRCKHCGERIVARGFGRCPACLEELPEELQLSEEERRVGERLRDQRKESSATDLPSGGTDVQ